MANKPVFGVAICPKCNNRQPIFWNGKIRRREKEFYGAKGYEGVLEHSATDALRNIGVDIRELAREYGEPVVRTEVK